jgi:2-polyprenyl-6-methoxyphenol hydroxylase-like FAD-dependent oxidoreductase
VLQHRSDTFDAIVVGARCTGSPLATLLARRGLKICVIDRATLPSDTPSTHGIQPAGVKALDRLGVLERLAALAPPIDSAFIALDDHRAEVPDLRALLGAPMLSVRRLTLDAILCDHAREAGADVRTGTTLTGLLTDAGRVVGVRTTAGDLRARLVVGADGARSSLARLVGAEEYHLTPARRAFLWSYFDGVDDRHHRLWLGSLGDDNFLASPTDGGLFLVAYVAPIERRDELRASRESAFEDGIRRWPELAAALAGARRAAPVQLMTNWHGFFRRSAGPGWVLVGDAGHFKDPTPGQGIADALRQVERLAPAIERSIAAPVPNDEPLERWWRWRDKDAWDMYWFAADMGRSDSWPQISAAADRRMTADPALLDRFLRVLNHDLPASRLITPTVGLSILRDAMRENSGSCGAVLKEVRFLAGQELARLRERRRRPRA